MENGEEIMRDAEDRVSLCKRVLRYREFLADLVLVKSDGRIELSWDADLPHDDSHFRVNHYEPGDWPELSDDLLAFLDVIPAQAYC